MPEDLNKILYSYLDGALSPAQRARLEARLSQPAVARSLARARGLRAQLLSAMPAPSEAQSRRMWMGIRSQVSTQASFKPQAEAWYAFLTRPWLSPWGLGLSGAAAALALAF